jgi:hypothetical protein
VTDAGLRKEKKILDEAYLRSGGVLLHELVLLSVVYFYF